MPNLKVTKLEIPVPKHVDMHNYFNDLNATWTNFDRLGYFSNEPALRVILGSRFRVDVEHGHFLVFRCQEGTGYTTSEWQKLVIDHLPEFPKKEK